MQMHILVPLFRLSSPFLLFSVPPAVSVQQQHPWAANGIGHRDNRPTFFAIHFPSFSVTSVLQNDGTRVSRRCRTPAAQALATAAGRLDEYVLHFPSVFVPS